MSFFFFCLNKCRAFNTWLNSGPQLYSSSSYQRLWMLPYKAKRTFKWMQVVHSVRTVRMVDYPGLSRWVYVITMVLVREIHECSGSEQKMMWWQKQRFEWGWRDAFWRWRKGQKTRNTGGHWNLIMQGKRFSLRALERARSANTLTLVWEN